MLPANFNQLYYFWTVARTGSISEAARRLLLNQSTVSLQMKQLESALGTRLMTRGRPGTALTERGRVAFEYCDRIFGHSEEMLSLLRGGAAAGSPQFRLGVSQSVPRSRVLELADRLKSLVPRASVRILSRSSEELESRLERRMLDLVLSDLDLSVRMGRDWRARLAWDTPLFFVATPRLRRGAGAFPRALGRIPLLLRAPENPVRKAVDSFLAVHGISADVRAEVEDPELLLAMALRGEGAAVMDPEAIDAASARGRLAKLHRRPIGVRETLWLVCGPPREKGHPFEEALESLMRRPRGDRPLRSRR